MVSVKEYFDSKDFKERIKTNIQTVTQMDDEGESFIYKRTKYYYLMYNIIVDSFFKYTFYADVEGMLEKESDRNDEVVCVWWCDLDDDISEEKGLEFIEKCERRWDKMIEGSSGYIWDKYSGNNKNNESENIIDKNKEFWLCREKNIYPCMLVKDITVKRNTGEFESRIDYEKIEKFVRDYGSEMDRVNFKVTRFMKKNGEIKTVIIIGETFAHSGDYLVCKKGENKDRWIEVYEGKDFEEKFEI